MTTTSDVKVCMTECSKCNHSETSFAPVKGDCPRCGNDFRVHRWINKPHKKTVQAAMEHDFGRLMVYSSNRYLGAATKAQRDASRAAAERDGGAGVIKVGGVDCYVEE